ncbi:DUF2382 domain-containing protein [Paenisporosarcina quisquiliarum]|uniref:DUF2382 domain-containing protein n=1 Tax=Paenisporosarcina quisquiliarum TaxID=365346 RepID=A0A9X3LK10_9BACL|nr:DUF2382 domain-containing protein [Paenisporosarcina quisquiliarum]MCZ8537939.1 DUF2382 domain-containing protein [Paenisporosarcina quisquiliarum]
MESRDNKLYGVFNNETELQQQIDVLKAQGYSDEDMYVVANRDDQISMVRGSNEVGTNTEGGSWWDKFKSFMLGEDSLNDGYHRMGFDDREREHYSSEVQNGKILLYVDREYGANFGNYDDSAIHTSDNAYETNSYDRSRVDGSEEEHIELHEERLNVDKTRVQTGEVNVNKHVVEEEQTVEVPVEREEVYVERRAVNRETGLDSTDDFTTTDAYQEDGTIHIPVSEEQVEVTKKDVVTEEIVIGKRKVQDTETVSENVRHEEVDIDDTTNTLNRDKDRF